MIRTMVYILSFWLSPFYFFPRCISSTLAVADGGVTERTPFTIGPYIASNLIQNLFKNETHNSKFGFHKSLMSADETHTHY